MSMEGLRSKGVETGQWVTPDSPESYVQTIKAVELPPKVTEHADAYDRQVGERRRFLWKWIHNLFDEFTLSCVDAEHLAAVKRQKTLLTMFITTLDDLAEQQGNDATFERARYIPFHGAPDDDGAGDEATLSFLADVWEAIEDEYETAPRHDEFADLFDYDLRQSINAMNYSQVLNDNQAMANLTEAERYDAHNMTMFPYACIDLMHSSTFDRAELGTLRSILSDLQQMARIGNWVTTWNREVHEADCSSGILVRALQRGVIEPGELNDADEETAERIVDRVRSYGIESEFIREWEIRNRSVRKRTTELDTVDGNAIVDGLETVMQHHLASDGFK